MLQRERSGGARSLERRPIRNSGGIAGGSLAGPQVVWRHCEEISNLESVSVIHSPLATDDDDRYPSPALTLTYVVSVGTTEPASGANIAKELNRPLIAAA
jgi:hypothetical protein